MTLSTARVPLGVQGSVQAVDASLTSGSRSGHGTATDAAHRAPMDILTDLIGPLLILFGLVAILAVGVIASAEPPSPPFD